MMTIEGLTEGYRGLTAPRLNPMFEGFWAGAREHDIRLPRCSSCGQYHWYPLHACPYCHSADWSYASVGLDATLFSYGIVRRPLHPGLVNRAGDIVALVVPDRAPKVRLVTNLVGTDPADIAIDAPVRAEFVEVNAGWTVPVYRVVSGRR